MNARQLDIAGGHHSAFSPAVTADDGVAPQEHALFRLRLTAEIHRPVGNALALTAGNVVIEIEDGLIARLLVAEDILLGGHVLRHVLVNVQMVGRQIGQNGDMGTARHGHQLEAGQLQHRVIGGLHLPRLTQQRMADVAAHMDGAPRLLQKLRDDGSGRGLSVAAGHGDDGTGADLKEHLHLGGQHTAASHSLCQLGHIGPQTRRAENDILIQFLQIVRAKLQMCAALLQLTGQLAQLLPRPLVAGGHGDALTQQQADQRRIADTDAHHRHVLSVDGIQILL